ncbi:hypothetical protein [Pseudomonas nitroreducens]|uniref:Uncharacterized protein n=1 Tax=Pseudomonas nitroreducens TaxID=46680 RepID=A0A6G6IUS3_PSENT|nr:hypothetical protein [Pseudomonas nitroreducens]QIE86809.1 hypothetical protein G5B91_11215 [Pseudomonas nitroreducens]
MSKLPRFEPILKDEMRALWVKHQDPDIRRLLLEVEHSRRVLAEVHDNFEAIHAGWREKVGGGSVAIHQMKTLLANEWNMGRYEKKGR